MLTGKQQNPSQQHMRILPHRMKIQPGINDQGGRVQRIHTQNPLPSWFYIPAVDCSEGLQGTCSAPALLLPKELTAGHKRTSFAPPASSSELAINLIKKK